MTPLDAVTWVLSLDMALRLSQQKTLAALVGAALRVGRVSLAALGRQLTSQGLAKHRIKRVWRFCANERVKATMAPFVAL